MNDPFANAEPGFSPVDNEPPIRLLRRLRLVPPDKLGVARRALLVTAVTYLPILAWAIATGRITAPEGGESILRHFNLHVRCLFSIPLLVAGEAVLHVVLGYVSGLLLVAGLVPDDRRAAFDSANESIRRLRDAKLPWLVLLGITVATAFGRLTDVQGDSIAWALDPDGTLGFGGRWYLHIVRPVFLGLCFAWLWRLVLVTLWCRQLAGVKLALVPTHPDGTGGMSIVKVIPAAFAPFSLAISAVLASAWAHRILSHDANLQDFVYEAILFTLLWSVLILLPLLVLAPMLSRVRRRAIVTYGALVGRQGRLTHQRWIEGELVGDEPLLSAPEIGPIADAGTMYQAVVGMQPVPIGKMTLGAVLAPVLVPFLIVVTLEIPLSEMLQRVLKILM